MAKVKLPINYSLRKRVAARTLRKWWQRPSTRANLDRVIQRRNVSKPKGKAPIPDQKKSSK
jgi:hypothetical protein